MKGISPLVGTVLLIVITLVGVFLYWFLSTKTVTTISPGAKPNVSLTLASTRAWDNLTEITLLHQGGEILRCSDVSFLLEGVLVSQVSGENVSVRLRLDNLSTEKKTVQVPGQVPDWAKELLVWCSDNLIRNRFSIWFEGSENAHFIAIERAYIIHHPASTSAFILSSPLSVPYYLPPAGRAKTVIENIYIENTLITTQPAYGSLLTLKLSSTEGPIEIGKIWAWYQQGSWPKDATLKGNATVNSLVVLTENAPNQWGALEYQLELTRNFYSEFQYRTDYDGGGYLWFYFGCSQTPQTESDAAGGYFIVFNQADGRIELRFNGSILTQVSKSIQNGGHLVQIYFYSKGSSNEFSVYFDGVEVLDYEDLPRILAGKLAGIGARTSSTYTNEHTLYKLLISDLLQSVHVSAGPESTYVAGKVGIGIPYYYGLPISEALEVYGNLKLSGPSPAILGENLRIGASLDNTAWFNPNWLYRREVKIPEVYSILSADNCSTVQLTPEADAKVTQGGVLWWQTPPDTNYGTTTDLRVESYDWAFVMWDHRSYLRFDLSSIPPGSTIISAKLRLYCTEADYKSDSSMTVVLHFSTDAWGETTITWNNQPFPTSPNPSENIIGSITWYGPNDGKNPVNEWKEWNVPYDIVQRELNSDNKISFMIRTDIEDQWVYGIWASFDSREATNPPVLEVTYTSAGNVVHSMTDVQVCLNLNTAALIQEGKLRSDLADLRFTAEDGVTELPWWVEFGKNTNSTRIWVRVPSTPGKIYMYYGNPGASLSPLSDNIDAVMDPGLRYFYYAGTNFEVFKGTDFYDYPSKEGGYEVSDPGYTPSTHTVTATFKGTRQLARNRLFYDPTGFPPNDVPEWTYVEIDPSRDWDGYNYHPPPYGWVNDGSLYLCVYAEPAYLSTDKHEAYWYQNLSTPIPAGTTIRFTAWYMYYGDGELDAEKRNLEIREDGTWKAIYSYSFSGSHSVTTNTWYMMDATYTTQGTVDNIRIYLMVSDYEGTPNQECGMIVDDVSFQVIEQGGDWQETVTNGSFLDNNGNKTRDYYEEQPAYWTLGDHSDPTEADKHPGWAPQDHTGDGSGSVKVWGYDRPWDWKVTYDGYAYWSQTLGSPVDYGYEIYVSLYWCYGGDGELNTEEIRVDLLDGGSWTTVFDWYVDGSHSVTLNTWFGASKTYVVKSQVTAVRLYVHVYDSAGIGGNEESWIAVDDLSVKKRKRGTNAWENLAQNFSLRWEGWVKPYQAGQSHTFCLVTDDAGQLYLNNQVVISQWKAQGPTEYAYTTTLDRPIPIRIEMNQGSGWWALRLGWTPPGGSKTYPIPADYLRCRKPGIWEPEAVKMGMEQRKDKPLRTINTNLPILGSLKVLNLRSAGLENGSSLGAENKWWVRVGGLLLQWGQKNSGLSKEGGFTISFPVRFNSLPIVVVTPEIPTTGEFDFWVCQVYNVTRDNFSVWLQADKSITPPSWDIPVHWMAIGW